MDIEWSLTAESYFDQLPSTDRSKIAHMVKDLAADWERLEESHLHKLSGDQDGLSSLRVGADLRVIVRRREDVITVVDVVKRSQIDGLRRMTKQHQPIPG